jgi:hypothetical protein
MSDNYSSGYSDSTHRGYWDLEAFNDGTTRKIGEGVEVEGA